MITVDSDSSLLNHIRLPCTLLASGCTMAGKSSFLMKLLINHESMFDKPVGKFVYCYSVWSSHFDELQSILGDKIEFRKDIPTTQEICDFWETYAREVVCICDDQMHLLDDGVKEGKTLLHIATTLAHHAHFSLFLTVQNLFYGSKTSRCLSLNCHYFCLFRNHRSLDQIRRFSQQTMPGQIAYFMQSFAKATTENYSYLFVDLAPHSDQRYKLKTGIFPTDKLRVFLPGSTSK